MSVELLYTSAVQGLKQGSRGFCTVISTAGMPINLATRLEGLSAYRHIYPPNHPDAAKNPVNFSHLRINVGGRPVSILSRVADYGIDYSQRTNKLAHHVVVEAHEQTPAGPAWLMQNTSILRSRWDGQCATPASGPTVPMQDQTGKICTTWKSLSGDAGWGGVVADSFASAVGKPLWIIYDLGQREQLLTLLNEAIALLPHEKRWSATFSTYATNVPPDADCKVRCVPAGSDDARLAPAMGKVIDLTKTQTVPAVTELVTAAREGMVFTPKPVPSAPRPMAVEAPQVHSTIRQPDVNDFELVEDDFEMKLKPIGPPNVTSAHRPPSPPPAVRSRPTPQANYAQLAPDTPDSNSWMKWALVGASVTIVCLMIAIGGLVFSMKSKDVAQKEEKPAVPVESQESEGDPKTEAGNNEPPSKNDASEGENATAEVSNVGPGRTLPDPQGIEVTEKPTVTSNATDVPSPQITPMPPTDSSSGSEKTKPNEKTVQGQVSEDDVHDESNAKGKEKVLAGAVGIQEQAKDSTKDTEPSNSLGEIPKDRNDIPTLDATIFATHLFSDTDLPKIKLVLSKELLGSRISFGAESSSPIRALDATIKPPVSDGLQRGELLQTLQFNPGDKAPTLTVVMLTRNSKLKGLCEDIHIIFKELQADCGTWDSGKELKFRIEKPRKKTIPECLAMCETQLRNCENFATQVLILANQNVIESNEAERKKLIQEKAKPYLDQIDQIKKKLEKLKVSLVSLSEVPYFELGGPLFYNISKENDEVKRTPVLIRFRLVGIE